MAFKQFYATGHHSSGPIFGLVAVRIFSDVANTGESSRLFQFCLWKILLLEIGKMGYCLSYYSHSAMFIRKPIAYAVCSLQTGVAQPNFLTLTHNITLCSENHP